MKEYLLSPPARKYLLTLFLTAVGYAFVGYMSFYLIPADGTGASLVWPVSAIGLAALFLGGYELWPALLLPFFFVLLARGYTAPLAIVVALGNLLESFIGAYILKFFDFSPLFGRLRDTLSFIVAAVSATLVSSLLITAGSYLFGPVVQYSFNTPLWSALWVGHAVSILAFGPFILYWINRPLFHKTRREMFEGVLVFGSVAVLAYLSAWTHYSEVGPIPLLYLLVIGLIWASLRTGPRGISLSLATMAGLFAGGVLFGNALTSSTDIAQQLFSIQVLIGLLAIIFLPFTSITEERKDAMKVLERHVGQLESALDKIQTEDQAKADFIAILAHELRNPLSPLLSGLELLKSSDEKPDDILQMMGAHMYTLARLLDDLLDITRISQKKFKLQKQMVELHSVISQSLEMAEPYLKSRSHTLTVSLPQDELWLNGDPVRLSQIFVNLLNNAGKYTDPGGTITLTATREGAWVTVSIKDNGVGIAPERIGKVFEAFGGNESGPERRPGGLRIGLSLAKRMAEMHGGTIEPKSAGVGFGTEFVVRLPLPPTRPLPLEEPRVQQARGRFSRARGELARRAEVDNRFHVLVVDDNEAAAQTLSKLLENQGHQTTVAYDGYEALAKIDGHAPQAALLDIGLPGMNGYELGRTLRERFGRAIMLVALTGYGQEEDKQKAMDAGFDEHLVKPVSIVDIERVLARPH